MKARISSALGSLRKLAAAAKTRISAALRRRRRRAAEVTRPREPLAVRFVSRSPLLRRIAADMGQSLKKYIPRAAVEISPYRFAAEHLFYTLFLGLPAAAAAPLLALLVHPLFLLLLFAPLICLALPWLRLRSMIGDRKRAADAELPFFAIHAAIGQTAGLSLYDSLCSTMGKGVLREMERGARLAKRSFRIMGTSAVGAIERLGMEHPHPGMRALLLGYASELRSGGNVAGYLEDKADELLRLARHRWERYVRNVGTIAEITLSTLLVLPLLLLMALFLSPGSVVTLGVGFLAVGIPLLIAMCFSMLRAAQPRDYTRYDGSPILPLLAAPIAGVLLLRACPLWIAVCISAGIGFLLYGIPVMLQRAVALSQERSLPDFLRDVTELQKLNIPVAKAIVRLRERSGYTREFRRLLDRVARQLQAGRSLSEVRVPTRSWLVRLTFFHLTQIAESGGIAVRSMELLTDFITRVKEDRDEARSSVSIYRYISLAAPFMLAAMVGGMIGAIQMLNLPEVSGAAEGLPAGLPLSFGVPPLFRTVADATVFLSSAGLAFLTSYAADLTPKNTVWVGLGCFLAGVAIWVTPMLSGWLVAAL